MKVELTDKGFTARWTSDDRKRDLPRRFARALVSEGAECEKTITSLIEEWASQVEAKKPEEKPRRRR